MESSEAAETVLPGRRRTQPSSAELPGTELSTGSVLAVLFSMTVLTYLVAWTYPSFGGLAAWLLADEAVKLVLWLGILGMLIHGLWNLLVDVGHWTSLGPNCRAHTLRFIWFRSCSGS